MVQPALTLSFMMCSPIAAICRCLWSLISMFPPAPLPAKSGRRSFLQRDPRCLLHLGLVVHHEGRGDDEAQDESDHDEVGLVAKVPREQLDCEGRRENVREDEIVEHEEYRKHHEHRLHRRFHALGEESGYLLLLRGQHSLVGLVLAKLGQLVRLLLYDVLHFVRASRVSQLALQYYGQDYVRDSHNRHFYS